MMQISLANRQSSFAPPPPRREWDEDQARWEARLRRLAMQPHARTAPDAITHAAAGFAPAQTILELAPEVTRRDVLLMPRALPAFTGKSIEDLLCGRCSAVIGSRISMRLARREHPEGDRLVVRCTCKALNLLSRDPSRSRHVRA